MRVLIIGCGLVGKQLAKRLRAERHHVIGTTTTPAKVQALSEVCSEVKALRGSDREKVHAAAKGVDAIAVCAGPAAQQAMTPAQRKATYHEVLVETALSAATAPIDGPVIALSSLSVYGDAANHLDIIDEDAPLTTADDASPTCFQAAERAYREHAGDRACIFRCSDIMGAEDPPIEDKIRMAHQLLKGSVPFHDQALFYRVHTDDVVGAIKFAIDTKLTGTFNLTHEQVPPGNKTFFDAICEAIELPPLTFRNELLAPTKPVSTARLRAAGYTIAHSPAESMPAPGEKAISVTARPKQPLNLAGRELVLAVLETLQKSFALEQVTGAGGAAYQTLTAQGGPLDGRQVGELRVFRGGPIHKLVYSAMTIEDFGMDTHQLYAFTAPDSGLPHLFLDVAISPNTDSTFHIGVDLIPRADLGANLAYLEQVFAPLTQEQKQAFATPGVMPATTVGPMHYALRSPWMFAAYVEAGKIGGCARAARAYVDHWLGLVQTGLAPAAQDELAGVDLAARDRKNRGALFSPRTNFVWTLLARLLGDEQTERLRHNLIAQDA
jgi:nucleoside-diphosphate-sugar epimerase